MVVIIIIIKYNKTTNVSRLSNDCVRYGETRTAAGCSVETGVVSDGQTVAGTPPPLPPAGQCCRRYNNTVVGSHPLPPSANTQTPGCRSNFDAPPVTANFRYGRRRRRRKYVQRLQRYLYRTPWTLYSRLVSYD